MKGNTMELESYKSPIWALSIVSAILLSDFVATVASVNPAHVRTGQVGKLGSRNGKSSKSTAHGHLESIRGKFAQRTCQDVKDLGGIMSGRYFIEPSGSGADDDRPIIVECDFTDGQAVTIIYHDAINSKQLGECSGLDCYSKEVKYKASFGQIQALKTLSEGCSQHISVDCKRVTDLTCWWVGWNGLPYHSWDGKQSSLDTHFCNCAQSGSSVDQKSCNCRNNNNDHGVHGEQTLTDERVLPVRELRFGGASRNEASWSQFKLGPLRCFGKQKPHNAPMPEGSETPSDKLEDKTIKSHAEAFNPTEGPPISRSKDSYAPQQPTDHSFTTAGPHSQRTTEGPLALPLPGSGLPLPAPGLSSGWLPGSFGILGTTNLMPSHKVPFPNSKPNIDQKEGTFEETPRTTMDNQEESKSTSQKLGETKQISKQEENSKSKTSNKPETLQEKIHKWDPINGITKEDLDFFREKETCQKTEVDPDSFEESHKQPEDTTSYPAQITPRTGNRSPEQVHRATERTPRTSPQPSLMIPGPHNPKTSQGSSALPLPAPGLSSGWLPGSSGIPGITNLMPIPKLPLPNSKPDIDQKETMHIPKQEGISKSETSQEAETQKEQIHKWDPKNGITKEDLEFFREKETCEKTNADSGSLEESHEKPEAEDTTSYPAQQTRTTGNKTPEQVYRTTENTPRTSSRPPTTSRFTKTAVPFNQGKTQGPPALPLPVPGNRGKGTVVGCYADSRERILPHGYMRNSRMTREMCQGHCSILGFPLAGVQAGSECFCGRNLDGATRLNADRHCTMKCGGNQNQACGANWALTIIQTVSSFHIPVEGDAKTTGGVVPGCYRDEPGRVLPYKQWKDYSMTTEKCVKRCFSFGYPLAGVEVGEECWCGNNLNGVTRLNAAKYCTHRCTGNRRQACGGYWALTVLPTGL